jgi:hypothetical protein
MVEAHQITVREASEFCYEMRNKILAEHRKFTSAQGLSFAERHKTTPPSLEKLFDKYSNKKFGMPFSSLTDRQKSSVHCEIIEASSRDNPKFTAANKRLKIIGKVGIIVTGVLATYSIATSDNKPKEAVKQTIEIGSGAAGGWVAGLFVSSVCGPGAPFCAIALVLLGSIAGGLIGSTISDSLDDEIEEFTKWEIQ